VILTALDVAAGAVGFAGATRPYIRYAARKPAAPTTA